MGMARRERSAAEAGSRPSAIHTPSSPSRPPILCVYASRSDKQYIVPWATYEGAAAFIEALVAEEPDPTDYKWVRSEAPTRRVGIVYPSGLRIEGDSEAGFEKALETETSWELPDPYRSEVRQFLSDYKPAPDDRSTESRAARRTREPREPKPKREAGPKAPDGYVHVSTLLPDVQPPHARAALRKLGWEKPAYGWWFPAGDTKTIKAIKGALK
jgi:hypothetical protein